MKKNVYIYSIIALIIGLSGGAFYMKNSVANLDYNCYNYTETKWSCNINPNSCTAWANWKRTCNWTQLNTYNRWSLYRCSTSWAETRATYSVNSACSVLETDYVSPDVTEGWVE